MARRRTDMSTLPLFSSSGGLARDDLWSFLGRALDGLGEGLLVCEPGPSLHFNRTCCALLREDPEADRLRSGMEELALEILGKAPRRDDRSRPARARVVDVRTARGRYQLRGTRMPGSHLAERGPALVVLRRWPSQIANPDTLRRRFGLTQRQALITTLLAERRTNKEIARILSISPHTVKRHTEMVLLKLGVSSRRSVAEVVRCPPVNTP